MIYFTHADGRTATAETDAAVQRLERTGYTRCTVGVWRAARQAQDAADQARIDVEDWLEKQNTPVPVMVPVK